MATRFDPARKLAASLDQPPELSIENLVQKFLLRWKLFVACVIIAPAVAVGLAALVPVTYKATAQVLIRHQGGADVLSGDAAPLLSTLSGATTAELAHSGPVVSRMVKLVGVEPADIPQPAYKVLFGRVAALIMPLFGAEPEDARLKGNPEVKYRILADDLKPAIDATTLMVDHGGATHDELIEVTLKANNRDKVADMVNTLCDSLVAESNQRAELEMQAAYKTLGDQAAVVEADLERRRLSAPGTEKPFQFERAANADNEPLAAGLARSISELEVQIATLRQTYADTAPEVMQVRDELARAEARLADQEATDAATDQLSTIRRTQRELLLGAQMAKTGQGGLSVVERALPPKKSKLVQLIRFGIPAGAGLVGGALIGGLAVVMVNLLDPRLLVGSDVTPSSGLRLLGTIPNAGLGVPASRQWADLPHPAARPALLQVLGRLDTLEGEPVRVLAVTSAENESASAAVALQLAALMALDYSGAVLLIDANFDRPQLTEAAAAQSAAGLIEAADPSAPGGPGPSGTIDLTGSAQLAAAIRPLSVARLGFVGTGPLDRRDGSSRTSEGWRRVFAALKQNYATIVVHLPGLLNSREAAALAKSSDQVLVVTSRRRSNRHALRNAANLLAELGTPVLGAVHCEAQ